MRQVFRKTVHPQDSYFLAEKLINSFPFERQPVVENSFFYQNELFILQESTYHWNGKVKKYVKHGLETILSFLFSYITFILWEYLVWLGTEGLDIFSRYFTRSLWQEYAVSFNLHLKDLIIIGWRFSYSMSTSFECNHTSRYAFESVEETIK